MEGFRDLRQSLGSIETEPIRMDEIECDGLKEYLRFYSLWPADDVFYRGGVFESNGFTLSGHIFSPSKETRRIVILHHGYLHHVAQFRNLLAVLLDAGFAVAMYDMPGHGLSSAVLGDIEDFDMYSNVLSDFIALAKGDVYDRVNLTGISLGGAVTFDYLRRFGSEGIEKVILAAPLVRCRDWTWTKIGMGLAGLFVKYVPRLKNTESSDEEFIDFNNNKDGLAIKRVPLNWVKSMHRWEKKM